ncbi:ATP synthase delta chain chloroplastic [Prunus yedoensis var. nudiflora]|uniref:ATP synthase delta chain chloroplastic n=1 Tax=Prunus yedoensis var. nudiflora TaxID=2094558 RepID=A0A314YYU1_PRUYE|nr:ATP synthase delta chain chloroplastic [Prunus yedoensis var. nudiflora]
MAKSNNTLKTTAEDMEKIRKFFGEPSVFDFFINPTIDLDKKCKVLDEIAESSTLQPHIVNFLNILANAK